MRMNGTMPMRSCPPPPADGSSSSSSSSGSMADEGARAVLCGLAEKREEVAAGGWRTRPLAANGRADTYPSKQP